MAHARSAVENFFRVSSGSLSTSVAGAIAKSIRDGNSVIIQTIGAGAVNQAVKAVALARRYLAADQLDVVFVPEFVEFKVDGNERTAIRLTIGPPGYAFPRATPIARRDNPAGGHIGA
jgi:stage V sporulation protein S